MFYQITKHISRTYLTLHARYLLPAILPLTMWHKHWRLGFVVPKQKANFFPKWVLNDIKYFITKLSFLTPIIRIWSHCKMCFVWQKKAFRRFCLLRIVVISKPCYEMWDFERLVVHFWVNVGVCWWTFFESRYQKRFISFRVSLDIWSFNSY